MNNRKTTECPATAMPSQTRAKGASQLTSRIGKLHGYCLLLLLSTNSMAAWDPAPMTVTSVQTYLNASFIEIMVSPAPTVVSCTQNWIFRVMLDGKSEQQQSRLYSTLLVAFTTKKPVYIDVGSCMDIGNETSRPELLGIAIREN